MLRNVLSALKARIQHDTLAEQTEAYLIGFQVADTSYDPLRLQELIDNLEPLYYRIVKRILAETDPDAYASVTWRPIDE